MTNNANPQNAGEPNITSQQASSASDHTWRNLCLFLLACMLSTLLAFWPWVFGSLLAMQAPAVVTDAGTVLKIRYVSGFRTDTQIDTESQSFLVRGVANLSLGTPLQVKVDFFVRRLCISDTESCGVLRGD